MYYLYNRKNMFPRLFECEKPYTGQRHCDFNTSVKLQNTFIFHCVESVKHHAIRHPQGNAIAIINVHDNLLGGFHYNYWHFLCAMHALHTYYYRTNVLQCHNLQTTSRNKRRKLKKLFRCCRKVAKPTSRMTLTSCVFALAKDNVCEHTDFMFLALWRGGEGGSNMFCVFAIHFFLAHFNN